MVTSYNLEKNNDYCQNEQGEGKREREREREREKGKGERKGVRN